MQISFLGATGTVTGSCYLLEHHQTKFLVDCGLYQGNKELKERNYVPFSFNPGEIDFVLLTHAHIDHSGLIPKLVKSGFKGPIFATHGTADLCSVMLPDSAYVQTNEVERKNRKALRAGNPLLEPIYTIEDADLAVSKLRVVGYGEHFQPCPELDICFKDAGHILGSAMTVLSYQEGDETRKLVFTGDLGRYDHYIVNDPEVIQQADFVVMETTYGNRLHNDKNIDRVARKKQLAAIITDTFQKGGNVVIPAFAVDRCQDIIMELNEIIAAGYLKNCKIYVDSPLAVRATEIFANHPECFDQATRDIITKTGRNPFQAENIVFSLTMEESIAINNIKSGAIIISASGMAEAGRIKHHLKHNLWRPESTVLFCGYQAEGTLGRRLLNGEKLVKIHGEEIDVRANILFLDGYSAHADRNELVHWLKGFQTKPAKVFLTHGEDEARADFAKTVAKELQYPTAIPTWCETFHLNQSQVMVEPERILPEIPQVVLSQLFFEINQQLSLLARDNDVDKLQAINGFIQELQTPAN